MNHASKPRALTVLSVAAAAALLVACERKTTTVETPAGSTTTTTTSTTTMAPASAAVSSMAASASAMADTAASATGNAIATAGAAIGDAAITAKVKTALLADPDVKGLQIEVDTKDGAVLLTGTADNESNIGKATTIARGIEGVKSVENKVVKTNK